MSSIGPADRIPVFLFDGDYYGTLAAARCFGRGGVPVTIAERRVLAPARWSRYVTRHVTCPDIADTDRFIDWLLQFGEREPGHVLYPTSDDLAWLFARYRDQLEPYFKLFQPGVKTIYALLNKQRLAEACADVGLATPLTWFPDDDGAMQAIAEQARYPALIKPQTQIFFNSRIKGAQVHSASELIIQYRRFVAANGFGKLLLNFDPHVRQPMVQAFHAEAAEQIYSLSGFVDRTGSLVTVRAARKVLQRPRKLGIGLCFEAADVDPVLCDQLEALCRNVGYYGLFEVEFIEVGGQKLLIDFNPRFYSQMAFEIARDLPLPLLMYHATLGDETSFRAVAATAQLWTAKAQHIYCHRFTLEVLLRAQRLSGCLTADEARRWRQWYRSHRKHATDAVADRSDPVPALIDVALQLAWYTRNPRAFVRHMVLDR